MGSFCKVVRSDVFFIQRYVAITSSSRASNLQYTTHLTFDLLFINIMTPSQQFFQLVGSRRRYLEDMTNLEEHLPNTKICGYAQHWGHVFSLRQAAPFFIATACDSTCRVIRVDLPHSSHTVRAVCSVTIVLNKGIITDQITFSLQISRLHWRHELRPLGSGPTPKFVNEMKFLEPYVRIRQVRLHCWTCRKFTFKIVTWRSFSFSIASFLEEHILFGLFSLFL